MDVREVIVYGGDCLKTAGLSSEEGQLAKAAPFPSFSFLIFGTFESGLDEDGF